MQKPSPTEQAILNLKNGVSVTELIHGVSGPSLGDYLFSFLCRLDCSVETVAGLAGLNKSSLYRILNGEVSPQRNVLLRLARTLNMDLGQTQHLLKAGRLATLSGSDPRDLVIIDGILRGLDIVDINDNLARNRYPDLFSKK